MLAQSHMAIQMAFGHSPKMASWQSNATANRQSIKMACLAIWYKGLSASTFRHSKYKPHSPPLPHTYLLDVWALGSCYEQGCLCSLLCE